MKLKFVLMAILMLFFGCEKKETPIVAVLITQVSSVDDNSFYQKAWDGILKYKTNKNLSNDAFINIPLQNNQDDLESASYMVHKNPKVIIAAGFYYEDLIDTVSLKYPNQKFVLVDGEVKRNNVSNIKFKMVDGAYLAGVIAAIKSKELNASSVGFIGGYDNLVIQEFESGFVEGVKEIDSTLDIKIEYTNDFSNQFKGQVIAKNMFDNGVKIIFLAAGNTGNGAINEAKQRASKGENVYIIGVDRDQYEDGIYQDNKSVILTSVLKKVDDALYDVLTKLEKNELKSSTAYLSIKDDAVGLPKNNPNLNDEIMKEVEKYKQKLMTDQIIVETSPERIRNSK